MSVVLLDAGPVIASLDRRDPHHGWVVQRFADIRGNLVTTGAVITEATFFLQNVKHGIRRLVDLLDTSSVEIWDCFSSERLRLAEELMGTYVDTPMDFADATLVLAAEHYQTGDILTLDERGFRTYRHKRNKRFRLLLQEN